VASESSVTHGAGIPSTNAEWARASQERPSGFSEQSTSGPLCRVFRRKQEIKHRLARGQVPPGPNCPLSQHPDSALRGPCPLPWTPHPGSQNPRAPDHTAGGPCPPACAPVRPETVPSPHPMSSVLWGPGSLASPKRLLYLKQTNKQKNPQLLA
jgi:hypothetical protein